MRSEVNSRYGDRACQEEEGKLLCRVAVEEPKVDRRVHWESAVTLLEHRLQELAAGMGQMKEQLVELQ